MPRKIRREHAEAVIRERARQQRPGGVIKAGAVQKNNRGKSRIEIASARALRKRPTRLRSNV